MEESTQSSATQPDRDWLDRLLTSRGVPAGQLSYLEAERLTRQLEGRA